MVTSMRTQNVESVMCDGRWLYRGGKVLSVDEAGVIQEAKSLARALAKRARIKLPDRFKVQGGQ